MTEKAHPVDSAILGRISTLNTSIALRKPQIKDAVEHLDALRATLAQEEAEHAELCSFLVERGCLPADFDSQKEGGAA